MSHRLGLSCLLGALTAAVCLAPGGVVCVSEKMGLGTLGGGQSIAAAVNDQGWVVGGAETADGHWQAFLWSDGVITNLGTLGGDNSEAHDISNGTNPLVVGTSEVGVSSPNDPNVVYYDHAFLWQDGVMTDLGTLDTSLSSEAWAVSDDGKVVGSVHWPGAGWHAVLWENGVMTVLGTLHGGESCALGVNNAGQVVGWSMTPGVPEDANDPEPPDVRRAFLWTAGAGMTDLGTLGGRNSSAYAINDEGYVVGWSDTAGGQRHVFLWQTGSGMSDLGTLGGPIAEAWGAGSGGLAGYSLDPNGVLQGMWWFGGQMWPVGQPLGGQGPVFVYDMQAGFPVVGSARTPSGDEHAFYRQKLVPTEVLP